MRRKRLLWQLFPSYLLITLASLVAVAGLASVALERTFVAAMRHHLREQAEIIDRLADIDFTASSTPLPVCDKLHALTDTRITLIDAHGNVLCDSLKTAPLDNHSDRPEVLEALAGRVGSSTRYSSTLDSDLLYVAIPARRGGRVVGVVRAAVPLAAIARDTQAFRLAVIIGGLIIALLAAGVSWLVARRISRPLEEMRRGAQRFARGELRHKIAVPDSEETGALAEALNEMADQTQQRMLAMTRQASEQQAVLASMVEGVLAVDTEHRIISMNRAAVALLGNPPGESAGRSLHEVIRSAELRRLINHTLLSAAPVETDIVMRGDTERVLQAHATALRDAQDRGIGAVIVLNDVTRYRQLESMRRDFVANVSHELKTPITSIKGFIETLLDGALENREEARRFLQIIAKQSDRLNSIIEDLLNLSKIEQSEESGDLALETTRLRSLLEAALYDCQGTAGERQVRVQLDCGAEVEAKINPPLMEQAVINLLQNAIKYSDAGGEVRLRAQRDNGEVVISVSDRGCGIPSEHLSRIFERFYRVDRARSRKLGGTGLGLSIVKHIVQAHHGSVLVESKPGEGSTFSIRIPG
ncbi:MAG TPA: ATP-binding protein [Pirellulales bacterium]|jgi:two-component system phosphate regulon sensor histidine kinase PhoR|nr:ATP-binding protein [Pirellulales bacterium]